MQLIDLDPQWFEYQGQRAGFSFLCSHCKKIRICCALIPLDHEKYHEIFPDWHHQGLEIVSTAKGCVWQITSEVKDNFAVMTIHPSINAERSGHCHISIVNGGIA